MAIAAAHTLRELVGDRLALVQPEPDDAWAEPTEPRVHLALDVVVELFGDELVRDLVPPQLEVGHGQRGGSAVAPTHEPEGLHLGEAGPGLLRCGRAELLQRTTPR